MCQPVVLASMQQPNAMAADETYVYWTGLAGTVARCGVAGCGGVPTVLTSAAAVPTGIAVDAMGVYWAESDGVVGLGPGIFTCPPSGCSPAPVELAAVSDQPRSLAIDATDAYWTTFTSVMKCALAGCGGTPTIVAAGVSKPWGYPVRIAVDATNVYWVNFDGTTPELLRCAKTGCAGAPTTLAAAQAESLAVDATNVYWTHADKGFLCPVSGCANAPSLMPFPAGAVTTDGDRAYWVADEGTVTVCRAADCAATSSTLTVGPKVPPNYFGVIASNATRVFWSDGGRVLAVAK
jgi:hypothetical protein